MKLFAFLLVTSVASFQTYPNSFIGRAGDVCSREQLASGVVFPSAVATFGQRENMCMGIRMPPFLKRLGLRKNVVEDTSTITAVAVPEDETATLEVVESEVQPVTDEVKVEEEVSETKKLLKRVKEAGTAGVISYALWELGFWTISVPVCIFGYREVTGHWPDFSSKEDLEKVGAEAFAFVNFARFAVPLRIGLALSTTPWIQKNVVDRFMKKEEEK